MLTFISSACRPVARVSLTAALACVAGTVASCAQSDQRTETALAIQALGVTGGSIPIPIDSTGLPSWDGSYAELLAADALTTCYGSIPPVGHGGDYNAALESTIYQKTLFGYTGQPDVSVPPTDSFLAGLENKMANTIVTCNAVKSQLGPSASFGSGSGYNAYDSVLLVWKNLRAVGDPAPCNATPDGNAAVLDVRAWATFPLAYRLEGGGAPALPAMTGTKIARAKIRVQSEVSYAWLNMCMVERLRDHLNSEQVIFASGDSVVQLQTIIRDRAMAAVQQLTMLAYALDKWGALVPASITIDSEDIVAPVFAGWAQVMPGTVGSVLGTKEQLGKDLALSVSRLLEATSQQLELLVRTGTAQSSMGKYENGQAAGPRFDGLRALYGTQWDSKPTIAIADLSAPQVSFLLALARNSDKLRLLGRPGQSYTYPTSFEHDIETSAAFLLSEIETVLRLNECTRVPGSPYCTPTNPSLENLLATRHQIGMPHARALMAALGELAFGPATSVNANGVPMFTPAPPLAALGRVTGTHSFAQVTVQSQATWGVKLDSGFTIRDLTNFAATQTYTLLPARTWSNRMLPEYLGFAARTLTQGAWTFLGIRAADPNTTPAVWGTSADADRPLPRIGAVPVLAAVSELGATLSSGALMVPFYQGAKEAFGAARAAVGSRVMLLRPRVSVFNDTGTAAICDLYYGTARPSGFTCNRDAPILSGPYPTYDLTVVTDNLDAATHLYATGTNVTPPTTTLVYSTPSNEPNSRIATAQLTIPQTSQVSLALGSSTAAGNQTFDGMTIGSGYSKQTVGKVLATEGELGARAQRLTAHHAVNWSRPMYDAFDLPTDWNPTGDASLHGGSTGEESHQYFLRAAKDSAAQATDAIQHAIEGLKAQAEDDLALKNAEQKASQLQELEVQSFCGSDKTCKLPSLKDLDDSTKWASLAIPSIPCPSDFVTIGGPFDTCTLLADMVATGAGVPSSDAAIPIPFIDPVKSQLSATSPDFGALGGGELEKVYMAQWNAYKRLEDTLKVAVSAARVSASELSAAVAEYADAEGAVETTKARSEANALQLQARHGLAIAEHQKWLSSRGDLELQLAEAQSGVEVECDGESDRALYHAQRNRELYDLCDELVNPLAQKDAASLADALKARADVDEYIDESYTMNFLLSGSNLTANQCRKWLDEDLNGRPVGRGRLRSCEHAGDSVTAAEGRIENMNAAAAAYKFALKASMTMEEDVALAIALADEEDAARRVTTALKRRAVAVQRMLAGVDESLVSVQAAYRDLLGTVAQLRAALNQTNMAQTRLALDAKQSASEIQLRFALRRKYNSYDLWRARALAENARRLAVAARRAIESRYVVDLSRLNAPEPFVEAPSLWADEVYGSDFKPPAAVGLSTGAGAAEGSVYSSKLIDYVNNLELFVQGYAIARPTSTARQDAEVIQLPGPATMVHTVNSSSGEGHSFVDPLSAGWSFYCETSGTWVANPHGAEFDVADGSLSKLCWGEPPTKARLGLWLDPWGRPYGVTSDPPYELRHNARWSRFAVNLVGAGIRDCSQATDSLTCYAEPFVRYSLRQVGTPWVTNYEEEWRSLDVPMAVVEGGKALATEEWLDPVSNGFNSPTVSNVARQELRGRPLGGTYELQIDLTPDLRLERIERIQILAETDYWVRQTRGESPDETAIIDQCGDGFVDSTEVCDVPVAGVAPKYRPSMMTAPVCPSDCDDLDPSTVDVMGGSPFLCTATCSHTSILTCTSGDGFCPASCTSTTDGDCDTGVLAAWKRGSATGASLRYVWDQRKRVFRGPRDPVTQTIQPFGGSQAAIVSIDQENYVQIEGARTNLATNSRNLANASWVKSGSPAVASLVYSGLDGTQGASSVAFGASTGYVQSNISFASLGATVSVFHRGGPAASTFNFGTSSPLFAANSAWNRSDMYRTDNTTYLPRLAGVANSTWFFDHAQYEVGRFPSSPIVTTSASVTRPAESLVNPASQLPAALRTGTWRVRVIPYFSSTDVLDSGSDAPVLTFVDPVGSAPRVLIALRPVNGGELQVQYPGSSASTVTTASVPWARHALLEIVVDNYRSRVTLTNLDTGVSKTVATYGKPAVASTWDLYVGLTPTNRAFFGLISEPRGTTGTPGQPSALVGSDPVAASTSADPDDLIVTRFDVPMNSATAAAGMTVVDNNGTVLPFTVQPGSPPNEVWIKTNSDMRLLTRHTVNVNASLKDTLGGAAEARSFQFVTRDGTWSPSVQLQYNATGVRKGPVVRHTSSGDAVVAWAINQTVYYSEFNGVTNTFGTPVALHTAAANIASVDLQTAPGTGTALVTWAYQNGASAVLAAARREYWGSWSSVLTPISITGTPAAIATGAVNDNGDAAVGLGYSSTATSRLNYKATATPTWGGTYTQPLTQHGGLTVISDILGNKFHAFGEGSTGLRWSSLDRTVGTWGTEAAVFATDPGRFAVVPYGTSGVLAAADVATSVVGYTLSGSTWTLNTLATVTANSVNAVVPASNRRGDALVLWRDTGNILYRTIRPQSSGTWNWTGTFSVIGLQDMVPCAAMDSSGNGMVVFGESGTTAQEVHRYSSDSAAWLTPKVAGTVPEATGPNGLGNPFLDIDDCAMSVDYWGRILVVTGAVNGSAITLRTINFE